MKTLYLEDDHKEGIVEMAEKLFPHFGDIQFDKDILILDHIHDRVDFHWFEFCMTHLCEKIFNPDPTKPDRTLQDRMKNFFWCSNMYWYCQETKRTRVWHVAITNFIKKTEL